MDGKAFKRTAKEINEVDGKFKFCWPRAHNDYDSLIMCKETTKVLRDGYCGICKRKFSMINPQYLKDICQSVGGNPQNIVAMEKNTFCPHCAARFFKP